MATFIELTNRVLDRFNEPRLASANFLTAVGFRQHVKQCVNDAIDEINNQQWEWPFNHVYSTQVCTPGQQIYDLPLNAKTVDWDTFGIEGFGRGDHLELVLYEQWARHRRAIDDAAQVRDYDFPRWVFRSQGLEFGISPRPDKEYTVKYEHWIAPTPLDQPSDVPTIPALYDSVIVNGAMKYAYLFRENFEASAMMDKQFDKGIKSMRQVLIRTPELVTDTRRL